jgi:hypothetical protein
MHNSQSQAGVHTTSIDVHCAGAALAMVAAFLRAEQLQLLSQRIQQRGASIDLELVRGAIHCQADWTYDNTGSLRFRSGLTVLHVRKNGDSTRSRRHLQKFASIKLCSGHWASSRLGMCEGFCLRCLKGRRGGLR